MILEKLKFMKWESCEKHFIKKIEIDNERIESLIKMSKKDFNRAKKEKDVSYAIERYYESIKKILTALLLKKGLKSRNHQCLISYLYKKYPEKEYECKLIQQIGFFRNRLNYYGEEAPEDFLKENKKDIVNLINWLLNEIKCIKK